MSSFFWLCEIILAAIYLHRTATAVECEYRTWESWQWNDSEGVYKRTREVLVRGDDPCTDHEQRPPLDCTVGQWGDWALNTSRGLYIRSRSVIREAELHGSQCPDLEEQLATTTVSTTSEAATTVSTTSEATPPRIADPAAAAIITSETSPTSISGISDSTPPSTPDPCVSCVNARPDCRDDPINSKYKCEAYLTIDDQQIFCKFYFQKEERIIEFFGNNYVGACECNLLMDDSTYTDDCHVKCHPEIFMNFNIPNSQDSEWDPRNWKYIESRDIVADSVAGATGKAGYFNGDTSQLTIPLYNANSMGARVYIRVRFKEIIGIDQSVRNLVTLGASCTYNPGCPLQQPPILLAFDPSRIIANIETCCSLTLNLSYPVDWQGLWKEVIFHYNGFDTQFIGLLTLRVTCSDSGCPPGSSELIASAPIAGNVAPVKCDMSVGGAIDSEPFEKMPADLTAFHGYMDYVTIFRCRPPF